MTLIPMVAVPLHGGGGAAAAEHERQMRREEEEMTPYTADDLAGDWEFKIIRSATSAFRSPQKLRELLEQESRAGWVLVEKFDDARVRLRRPAKCRERDGNLDFDPYRTYVGTTPGVIALMVIGTVLSVMAVIIAVLLLVAR